MCSAGDIPTVRAYFGLPQEPEGLTASSRGLRPKADTPGDPEGVAEVTAPPGVTYKTSTAGNVRGPPMDIFSNDPEKI
jgi:hypothetical protein